MVISLMFIITTINANSQINTKIGDGIIKGEVVDSLTKQPINYATVSVLNPKDSTVIDGSITKANGKFEISGLPNGEYLVKSSFVGFKNTYISNVSLQKGKHVADLGRVRLLSSAIMGEQIEVTGEKEQITYKIDKKVVNVSQFPSAQGGTAIDVLQNVPSVTIDNDGNVSLRGSANFTLLVDGRPTQISASTLLGQLPANMIENIEIITNPSAKYDPDGTAGIMNIITKKEKLSGTTGIINGSAGMGDKYNGDFTVNYRREKFNAFIGGDANSHRHIYSSYLDRENYVGNTIYSLTTQIDRLAIHSGYGLKAGIDYNLTDNDLISLNADFTDFKYNRSYPSDYHLWTNRSTYQQYYIDMDEGTISNKYYNLSANWQKQFDQKGHTLNWAVLYHRAEGIIENTVEKYYSNNDYSKKLSVNNKLRNINDGFRKYFRTELDYVLPINEKSSLEAGAMYEFNFKQADYKFDSLDFYKLTWVPYSPFTGLMDFKQNTAAIYTTYSNSLFGFDYKLGLRGEYYSRDFNPNNSLPRYYYDKYNLFPTFHISKDLKNDNQLQFSYSRRILRPEEQFLVPFPVGMDDYYVNTGNPDLKPEYTDSYELNYRKGFKKSFLSVESFYRQTNNVISRTTEVRSDNKIWLSYANLDKDYMLGVSVNGNISVTDWFKFNVNADFYNYHVFQNDPNMPKEIMTNVFNSNLIATFIPFKTTYIQLTANYYGTQLFADGRMEPTYFCGFSIRQDFLDRKLSIALKGQDMLNSYNYVIKNNRTNYKSNFKMDMEHQILTLSLSYKINNYQQQRRNSDSNVEVDYNGGAGIGM
jgi:outer membrane receptor protein involved in Fe transport